MKIMPPLHTPSLQCNNTNDSNGSFADAAFVDVNETKPMHESNFKKDSTREEKRNVTFNSGVKVRKIKSHRRYSAEEKTNIWMTSKESKRIRANAVKTVKKIMKGINVDADPNDCSRGLEFKTPKKNQLRQTRKLDIIWTVLGEQEILQEEGRVDPEHLATAYSAFTAQCAMEAHRRGVQDEKAARTS